MHVKALPENRKAFTIYNIEMKIEMQDPVLVPDFKDLRVCTKNTIECNLYKDRFVSGCISRGIKPRMGKEWPCPLQCALSKEFYCSDAPDGTVPTSDKGRYCHQSPRSTGARGHYRPNREVTRLSQEAVFSEEWPKAITPQ